MKRSILPRLADRVFAVRAAWRQQVPLRVRVEAVRSAASQEEAVSDGGRVPENSLGGPPVRRVTRTEPESRVA